MSVFYFGENQGNTNFSIDLFPKPTIISKSDKTDMN